MADTSVTLPYSLSASEIADELRSLVPDLVAADIYPAGSPERTFLDDLAAALAHYAALSTQPTR